MGLLEKFPSLDDKTFDDIAEEARSLISRYSSEWTDHNIHDPGITFIELFAWLAEMQIYQLNRVTDANYKKFLRLIGFYPLPVQPARVDITFKNIREEKSVKAGDQIITKMNEESIVFEIEEDFDFNTHKLKSVITITDSRTIDNTEANETDDIYFSAFGEKAPKGATLELGFDDLQTGKDIQINIVLFEEDLPSFGSHIDEVPQVSPSTRIIWEYFSGGKWKVLNTTDTTLALTRSGRIVFKPPSMGPEDKNVGRLAKNTTDNDLYWIRCRLEDGSYEIAPLISRILLNTISAIQMETIKNEELGISSGSPEQTVLLKRSPVFKRTVLDFSEENVMDWTGLLQKLKNQGKSDGPGPEKRMWGMIDEYTRTLIDEWNSTQQPDLELKHAMINAFNKILENIELYDNESFKKLKFSHTQGKLIERLRFISDPEMKLLNWFLIEAAFPEEITRSCMVIQVQGEKIQVQGEKYEWKTWTEVDDFESSGPDDLHYTLNPEEGIITFGNGLNGSIPRENRKIRALMYKITQGTKGNISKKRIFNISKGGFNGFTGENLKEATGGKSVESLEEAKGRARKDCRIIYRAITSEDYEQLALSTPGLRVCRAKAIPNHDPNYPCIEMPGAVTVIIVPFSRAEIVNHPGDGFRRTILQHLNLHRLITTNVYVVFPDYVMVSVKCNVHLKKYTSRVEVEKRIREDLRDFLDPLNGGQDKKGWPFGRYVYASDIHQIIDKVEGVDFATNVLLSDDKGQFNKEIIKISSHSLVYSGNHELNIKEVKI